MGLQPPKTHQGCWVEFQWGLWAIAPWVTQGISDILQPECRGGDWGVSSIRNFINASLDDWNYLDHADKWGIGLPAFHVASWLEPFPASPSSRTTHLLCKVESGAIVTALGPGVATRARNFIPVPPGCSTDGVTDGLVAGLMATGFAEWWANPNRPIPPDAFLTHNYVSMPVVEFPEED